MAEIVNPFMHISGEGAGKVPTLLAPVKRRGLLVTPLEPPLASLVWRLILQSRLHASADVEVSESERESLRRIGALIPREALPSEVDFALPLDLPEVQRSFAERSVLEAADALQRTGHVKLSDVLPSGHVALLNDYTTRIVREGWVRRDTFADRYVAHNNSVGKAYHSVLQPLMTRIARRALVPSYSYLASYLPGAHLPGHRDRPQCDYTLALHLGQEDARHDDWPLRLQQGFSDDSLCSYHCKPGEAVLYRGVRLHHERPIWKGKGLYNQMIWHFVEESFQGPRD